MSKLLSPMLWALVRMLFLFVLFGFFFGVPYVIAHFVWKYW